MATYSGNTTIKISAAVNQSFGQNSANTILSYTVPANSYLQCTVFGAGDATGTCSIGGFLTFQCADYTEGEIVGTFTLGPGALLAGSGGSSGTNRRLYVVGTLFTNSP